MPSKLILKILLYLSLAFLAWHLARLDYLVLGQVSPRPLVLLLSLLLLFAGFVLAALSWWFMLRKHHIHITPRQALVSQGLYVFAKYIPGKLWVVVGRAARVQGPARRPLQELSFISLKEQLIYLLLGLLLSVVPVYLLAGPGLYFALVLLTIVALAAVLFSPMAHRLALKAIYRLLKKKPAIPLLSLRGAAQAALAVMACWLAWSAAFYLLLVSIQGPLPPITAFAFPLSVAYGVLALIMPGGIGVREGIITAFLAAAGVPLNMAITLSVISRLWFVAGELFSFLLAVALKKD